MAEAPEQIVVLHIAKDGTPTLRVWGDERVCVLWVDENAPDDRVYRQTAREDDLGELKALIGGSTIGHRLDGRMTPEKEQAIRAMAWRLQGNGLGVVPAGEG